MLQSVLDVHKKIKLDIAYIRTHLGRTEREGLALGTRLNNFEADTKEIKAGLEDIKVLGSAVTNVQQVVNRQYEKLVTLDDRGREANIIVFGIQDIPDE
ncbi:hypothetical protein HPB48_020857 [Haemaphysalis longicornis]|uniref:Uncharacterized protein n=1 Tax=Haemaphysalis longicornis TaxID=44386 RepID=A0A9J6GCN1_HAELO|nr:hypothetical protein HPB48_020857 [Haemaphysalis longicornis]